MIRCLLVIVCKSYLDVYSDLLLRYLMLFLLIKGQFPAFQWCLPPILTKRRLLKSVKKGIRLGAATEGYHG